MRISRTRRLALAIGVLGAVIGLAPAQAAVGDEPAPALTVGSADLADYGPAAPLDVTVTSPSTADAYIELIASPNLHFTDDAGYPLPVMHTPDHGDVLTIGADDSDGNGVPGAALPLGTIHLHVSATYPVGAGFITGQVIDGATGKGISRQASGRAYVVEGDMYGQYQAGYDTWNPTGAGIPLVTGASYPLTQDEDTQYPFNTPDTTHLRLLFTPQQLAAAGYTAPQVVHALRIQYSGNSNVPTPTYGATTWTMGDDGSAWIDFPDHTWQAGATHDLHEGLRISAAWGLPAGKLVGQLQVLGSDGRQYAGDTEPLNITADVRPASLQAAFYGRDAAGVLWQYRGAPSVSSNAYYDPRRKTGAGWNTYTALTPLSSFKNNGTGDLAGRDHDGVLWYYTGTGNPSSPFAPRARVGAGWNTYTMLTGTGDVTGDGHTDLLGRDHDGVLWLYKGTASTTARFAPRTRIGAGWNTYNLITGAGDLTADGHPDLIARDTAGRLWLYQGTANATTPYKPRVRIGAGWQTYTHIIGIGDLRADGHADLVATDAAGTLWYYQGTGNPTSPYKPRTKIGAGWSIYNTLL